MEVGSLAAAGKGALILGGASSGKSMYAQRLSRALANGGQLFYLATMEPYDGEDRARIEKHRQERKGWGFETLEIPTPIGLGQAADRVRGGTVLLDSVTSLLTNSMFLPGGIGICSEEAVMEGIYTLFAAARNVVFVSDCLFSDGMFYEYETEAFRRQLGHLHCRIAAFCETVVRLEYGVFTAWKGEAQCF